tara:strand:+ start:362 stop:994 length:633 start_codon:yes stop_codon:yes gene_type:complete
MPVTINGNGSITGLTAGGLQSTALAGTLPNATFPAILPAVSGANLTGISVSVTASNMPAGSVIQTVNQQVAGGSMTNVTSSSVTYTGLYAEITPHLANSKILVMVNLIPYISGGGMDTGCGFTIQRKIGSGSYSILEGSRDATGHQQFYIFNGNSGSELICTFSDTCFDSPGTNSEVVRYQIYGSANSGGTVNLTSSSANHYITLMEIKQ